MSYNIDSNWCQLYKTSYLYQQKGQIELNSLLQVLTSWSDIGYCIIQSVMISLVYFEPNG